MDIRPMYRYRYMDSGGNLHGPLWLSQMRELYQNGRLSRQTEVSIEGSGEWETVDFHPEITSFEAHIEDLPPVKKGSSPDMVRLAIWTWILLLTYLAYLIVTWR